MKTRPVDSLNHSQSPERKREGEAPAEPRPYCRRAHPAHGVKSEGERPIIVFLTACTKGRRPWLATTENHQILRTVWKAANQWLVGYYTILPDHLHLFAAPRGDERSLDNWVRYWKSQFSKAARDPAKKWQTDHWDTRLRSDESYEQKCFYVRNNPVRHGLVGCAEDWPHQGVMNELPW